jgi:hypothetical protein
MSDSIYWPLIHTTRNYKYLQRHRRFHILQIAAANTKSSPVCSVFNRRSLATAFNSGVSLASCAQVLPDPQISATDLSQFSSAGLGSLLYSPGWPNRKRHPLHFLYCCYEWLSSDSPDIIQLLFFSAGTYLPSHCSQTVCCVATVVYAAICRSKKVKLLLQIFSVRSISKEKYYLWGVNIFTVIDHSCRWLSKCKLKASIKFLHNDSWL